MVLKRPPSHSLLKVTTVYDLVDDLQAKVKEKVTSRWIGQKCPVFILANAGVANGNALTKSAVLSYIASIPLGHTLAVVSVPYHMLGYRDDRCHIRRAAQSRSPVRTTEAFSPLGSVRASGSPDLPASDRANSQIAIRCPWQHVGRRSRA